MVQHRYLFEFTLMFSPDARKPGLGITFVGCHINSERVCFTLIFCEKVIAAAGREVEPSSVECKEMSESNSAGSS